MEAAPAAAKPEVNGNPLPQRQQKNQNQPKQGGGGGGAGGGDGGNQGQQNQQQQQQQGGGNKNQNQNNRNRNRGGGANGPNRGGGGGRNNFGNRNNQQGGGGQDAGNGEGGNNQQQQQNNQGFQNRNQGGPKNRGGPRNQGGDGEGGGGFDRRRANNEQYFIGEKLRLLQGPLLDLPAIESTEEVKFSGRNRLYIGNLTADVTEEELVELFMPYGEITEIFMNKEKLYAFVRVDFFSNAEKAKRELDGTSRKNRIVRVRFAPNATAIKVKNLTQDVSNELLYKAFEVFGPLERAVVQVDERGKSTGEGIVEYKNKPSAMAAQRYCSERCYFLNSSLRPCIVEPYTYQDNNADGLPEKSLNKKIPEFMKLRQQGPHFADMGSFEHEYGQRWKQMHDLFKQKSDALKREMEMEEEKLEAQMEYARYEHETEQLREQLRMREQDSDRQKAEWEMKERMAVENKQRNEIQMKHKVEEMQNLIKRTDEELHRRQLENNVFMQNQQMNILDGMDDNRQGFGNMRGGNNFDAGMEIRDYDHGQNNRQSRFDDGGMQQQQQGGGGVNQRLGNSFNAGGNNRNWMSNNRGGGGGGGGGGANNDDFQSKRRRF
ncbi:hrp65 protein-like [Culex pipiens pallens]|uniref:hrp65 protein-like n=1 Tax=Culex pipiens pallens TaxID=42434 RepID=UPI001953F6CF|nr:hrp65 protein-like [Culex pipiens pallens]